MIHRPGAIRGGFMQTYHRGAVFVSPSGIQESTVRKARASARELEEYEMHPYYGVRTQELKAHCRTAVSEYRRAAEVNREIARSHRQMAERIRKETSVKNQE